MVGKGINLSTYVNYAKSYFTASEKLNCTKPLKDYGTLSITLNWIPPHAAAEKKNRRKEKKSSFIIFTKEYF